MNGITGWTHTNDKSTHYHDHWTYTKDCREVGTVTKYMEEVGSDFDTRIRASYHVQLANGDAVYESEKHAAFMLVERYADPYAHTH